MLGSHGYIAGSFILVYFLDHITLLMLSFTSGGIVRNFGSSSFCDSITNFCLAINLDFYIHILMPQLFQTYEKAIRLER